MIEITYENWYKYVSDGEWHHICMTNTWLFIDGELVGENR